MKKALSLLLALVLCLSLCACGGQSEEQVETISIATLYKDISNGAKAQMNIGKSTTIYGEVTDIGSEECEVSLKINPSYGKAVVKLPVEVLAEMEDGQYVVIPAIVESAEKSKYIFTANELGDLSLMDKYVQDTVAKYCESYPNLRTCNNKIKSKIGLADLKYYVKSRGEKFMIMDNAKLKKYLIGKWGSCNKDADLVYLDHAYSDYSYSSYFVNNETRTFKANGTCLWEYQLLYMNSGRVSKDDQEDEWNVRQGKLDTNIGDRPQKVYALCEDAFICYGDLYIKMK